ncbi:hypothetical protein XELAEV_18005205mg [Xenopus laevis]|uniref:Uncharacterized protein n=1 Tax=Xenopus laevis TaxID=8355 RepID=A0A974I2X0_XENLA|nr:hypothetical protein XELAEV_18005205mg [Xenopus laevis]
MDPIIFTTPISPAAKQAVLEFSLQLIGSLTVNSLTTMSMLPWVVVEIKKKSAKTPKDLQSVLQIRLYVSSTSILCEPDLGKCQQWDPLICSSIFDCKPQLVQKLIHNSQDPSYFACLLRKENLESQESTCYLFHSDDPFKLFFYNECERVNKRRRR